MPMPGAPAVAVMLETSPQPAAVTRSVATIGAEAERQAKRQAERMVDMGTPSRERQSADERDEQRRERADHGARQVDAVVVEPGETARRARRRAAGVELALGAGSASIAPPPLL